MPIPDPAAPRRDARARPPAGADAGRLDGPWSAPASWPTGRLLSAVSRQVEREWNAHLAHWDLNHASLPVLAHLAGGPRSQREIAAACDVTEQTMSKVVARLERSGYVDRHPDAQDRRRHDVVLTPAGLQALAAAGDGGAAEALVVQGLDPAQVAQLRALLTAMITAHGALGDGGDGSHAEGPGDDSGPGSGPGSVDEEASGGGTG